ncbi:twin-arginine translocation signal domain-containing protein [Pedobacter sp. LMG 31462]|uniref:Twin-arginine translocation signal domain-containing protein n=1 Tax=Pedobacter gandavensis TaxID=2679963 RepID=A0ABR6EQ54_9SPHI|nr:twin-arginine translocation signal domain-containing protein [Pedobacter gandavensis]
MSTNEFSRRHFLKQTMMLSAAAALAPGLFSQSP